MIYENLSQNIKNYFSKKNLFIFIVSVLSLGVLVFLVRAGIKEIQLQAIRTQIETTEARIESNKQEWLNCDANMKIWASENEQNRKMKQELIDRYNSMVGFTQASQPQAVEQSQTGVVQ